MAAAIRLAIPTLNAGGAERVCCSLANHWASLGIGVEVLLGSGGGRLAETLEPAVHVVALGASRTARALLPFCRYLNRDKTKPVLAFGLDIGAGLGILRRMGLLHAPLIYREGSFPENKNATWLYQLGIRAADGIIVQTMAASRSLERVGVHGVPKVIVANPVSRNILGFPPDTEANLATLRIATAGRLEKVKRHDRLIEGFARLHRRHPEGTLVIAGEGGQRSDLLRMVDTLGLTQNVSLPGHVSDVKRLYQSTDLYVLSSAYEGQPNALIEALLAGCRIMAVDIPATRELLIEIGLEACLIREDSYTDRFTEKVEAVLALPPAVWSKAWLKLAAMTDPNTVGSAYFDFCEKIAHRGRGDCRVPQ